MFQTIQNLKLEECCQKNYWGYYNPAHNHYFLLFPILLDGYHQFKRSGSCVRNPPPAWIFDITWDNFRVVLFDEGIGKSLLNSLIVSTSTTIIALIIGVPAGYALAKYDFRGKSDLWFWFITNRMVSPIVLALPIFLISRQLHLLDTKIILILIYLTFNLPIVIWICTDQFASIAKELDEAALLEGVSQFRLLWSINLPLAAPGIAISAIFSFIFSWNELLYGLILTKTEARTAPAMAVSYMEGYEVPYGKIMATSTLIVILIVIFTLIVSKHLVRGLTWGQLNNLFSEDLFPSPPFFLF